LHWAQAFVLAPLNHFLCSRSKSLGDVPTKY
jgi:hypothetical protein